MSNETYECPICLHINHSSRYHCATCGTIPERYSVLHAPAVFKSDDLGIPKLIPVVIAYGARRQEHGHTSKTMMRTVPLDYYASE